MFQIKTLYYYNYIFIIIINDEYFLMCLYMFIYIIYHHKKIIQIMGSGFVNNGFDFLDIYRYWCSECFLVQGFVYK